MIEPLCLATNRLGRDVPCSHAPALESWFVAMLAKLCEHIEEYTRRYGGMQGDDDGEQDDVLDDAKCILATLEQMNSEHEQAARSNLAAACSEPPRAREKAA